MPPVDLSAENKKRPSFSGNKLLTVVLLLVIGIMLGIWKPWQDAAGTDRTVEVTGETVLTESPDEYVFSPSYQFKNVDKDQALSELTKKNEEVTVRLKELGVQEINLKTNSNGFEYPLYFDNDKTATYTLQFTVTVDNKELAQKVQDYLVSTAPVGSVSPIARFSEKKRKELENKARDEATKNARSKAEQSAANLGFKIGKVKSIKDSPSSDEAVPLTLRAEDSGGNSSLPVQAGQNSFKYSVSVVYYIR